MRTGLYSFQADTAGDLMRQAGYDDAMIDASRRRSQARHQEQSGNAAAEDIADLVFIEHYMLAFAQSKPTTTRRSGWRSSARPGTRCRRNARPLPCPARSGCRHPCALITKAISQ